MVINGSTVPVGLWPPSRGSGFDVVVLEFALGGVVSAPAELSASVFASGFASVASFPFAEGVPASFDEGAGFVVTVGLVVVLGNTFVVVVGTVRGVTVGRADL